MSTEQKNIYENIKRFRLLLTEYVDRSRVIEAIQNRYVVDIYYGGDDTINRGYRTIEPFALGRSTADNLVLRAWQTAGSSDSARNPQRKNDEIPGWRLFRLDGITTFYIRPNRNFKPNRPNYNPNDKGMTEIIVAIDPTTDADVTVGGIDSVADDNVMINRISAFDTQTPEFQKFYNAGENRKDVLRKNINDFYENIKFYQKRAPKNFIVISKDGRLFLDYTYNRSKYDKKEIMGNLQDLFNAYGKGEKRINKQFFEKQRKEFEDKLKKEITA